MVGVGGATGVGDPATIGQAKTYLEQGGFQGQTAQPHRIYVTADSPSLQITERDEYSVPELCSLL